MALTGVLYLDRSGGYDPGSVCGYEPDDRSDNANRSPLGQGLSEWAVILDLGVSETGKLDSVPHR